MTDYSVGPIDGLAGGTTWTGSWTDTWKARSVWYGVKAYDNHTGYALGYSFTSSNLQPDPRYQDFTTPWFGRTLVTP